MCNGNPEESMDRFLALGCVLMALALAALPLNGCVIVPDHGDDFDGDDDDVTGDDDDDATGDDDDGPDDCADFDGLVLTFDGAGNVNACFDTWTEEGVPLSIDGTPQCSNGNCTGADGSWDPGNVWTFAGAIVGDLSQLDCPITEVEVTDYTGVGAATLTLFDAEGAIVDEVANETPGQFEILTAGLGDGYPVASFALGGCETAWHTVRLF